MDFIGSRRRRGHQIVISDELKTLYPIDINLYQEVPNFDVQIYEFEELASERLQLFRILEQASQRGYKIYNSEWKDYVYSELNAQNLKKFYRLMKYVGIENPTDADLQARRADHISHFILRLVYCKTESLRRWFVMRELEWFKLRFLDLNTKDVTKFMSHYKFDYQPISSEEKSRFYQQLYDSTAGTFIIDTVDFYKVKISEVPTLVKGRKVFVYKGYAYTPKYELVTCIVGSFRTFLNKALAYAYKQLPHIGDDRINYVMESLPQMCVGKQYVESASGSVSLANLDAFAKEHFPLCMQVMYEALKRDHHLKHQARLELLLFLKGIGLSYEDTMTFWREEFTKKIDHDKFEKQYAYIVKHSFGKVGCMTSYSPFSCMKILGDTCGSGEYHGCPYKLWNSQALKSKLIEKNMKGNEIQDVIDVVTKGHYQVACSKVYEYSHHGVTVGINHPNQYFEESIGTTKDGIDNKPNPKVAAQSETNLSIAIDDINWDETFKETK